MVKHIKAGIIAALLTTLAGLPVSAHLSIPSLTHDQVDAFYASPGSKRAACKYMIKKVDDNTHRFDEIDAHVTATFASLCMDELQKYHARPPAKAVPYYMLRLGCSYLAEHTEVEIPECKGISTK